MRCNRHWWIGLILVSAGIATGLAEIDGLLPVAEEIRVEAARPAISDIGRPLPLTGSWNLAIPDGFSPDYQMDLIAKGHYLLPWFGCGPEPDMSNWDPDRIQNYRKSNRERVSRNFEAAFRQAARLHLPISFVTEEWEEALTDQKKYFDLPADQNPNIVTAAGKIQRELSPFGAVAPWHEIGVSCGKTEALHLMQEWDPNPPLVLFVSNNEAPKGKGDQDRRYLQQYGKEKTSKEILRDRVAQGWEERYRALQHGFVDQFTSANWKSNSVFVGYNVFGRPVHQVFGGWDGGSPSYYAGSDFTAKSPQIHWMNGPTKLAEIYQTHPRYWFELSVWDGNEGGKGQDTRRVHARFGQTTPPERYGGFIQFGMWLMRPRVVREFRGYEEKRAWCEPYFIPVVEAVDRVHTDPILRAFWRKGELVPNRSHPVALSITNPVSASADVDRWFLLDTDLDPARPWQPATIIPVFSLALVKGQPSHREWLVYAHAPLGARRNVKVTVPEFGNVTIDVSQAGSFYLLSEETRRVTTVVAGGPASVRVCTAPDAPATNTPVHFTAADPYSPVGELAGFRWDFGDGTHAASVEADHTYQKNGWYVGEFTATNNAGTKVVRQVPVSVGRKPDPGLVVLYPPFKTDDGILYDASGRTNHALRYGGRWVDDPERGPVLELDGRNDHVGLANTPDINSKGPCPGRTVLLWFNARNPTPRQILYEEGGVEDGLNILLERGGLQGGVWVGKTQPGKWLLTEPILPNHWYPIALVLKYTDQKKMLPGDDELAPQNLELFLNGIKVSTGAALQLPGHGLGANLGGNVSTRFPDSAAHEGGCRFAGRLGEVRVYNRALSPEEIADWSKPKP